MTLSTETSASSKPLATLDKPQAVLIGGLGLILLIKLSIGEYVAATAITQIAVIALATGAGYALGWFLSPQGAAFRTAVKIGLILFFTLLCLGDMGWMGWGYTTIASYVGFLMALGMWLGGVVRALARRPTTFGSAEWASFDYLQEHALIGSSGIRLGGYPADGEMHPLHYPGDRHLLTIAPTRSGKGTTAIVNNLLTYEGSVLVIDPKGENALITARQRINMGQDVHIVDPWNIASNGRASRFNPLDWLDPSDPDITENAMLLADALILPKAGKSDPFWGEEGKALLQGYILYVATDPNEAEHRHLPRVRDLLLLDGDDMKLLWQRMLDSDHHIVASTGARCLQKEERLLSNVIASAQAETVFLDSERVRASMATSDFRFEDLKKKGTSIYLVLPADRLNAFNRWLRLLIQQAITVNARNIAAKPDKPVLFLLDEMPSLGRLTMVEQAYRLMAGFGLILWGIVQDASQLEQLYGKSWEGFIANSGAVQYFGSRDQMTAEYFSALCGVTTVWNLSTAVARAVSYTSGMSGTQSSSSSTSGTTDTETTSATQRKLAYPDELMRLGKDRQLILIENHHPIIGIKQRWFDDPELKALGVNLHERPATTPIEPPKAKPQPMSDAATSYITTWLKM